MIIVVFELCLRKSIKFGYIELLLVRSKGLNIFSQVRQHR